MAHLQPPRRSTSPPTMHENHLQSHLPQYDSIWKTPPTHLQHPTHQRTQPQCTSLTLPTHRQHMSQTWITQTISTYRKPLTTRLQSNKVHDQNAWSPNRIRLPQPRHTISLYLPQRPPRAQTLTHCIPIYSQHTRPTQCQTTRSHLFTSTHYHPEHSSRLNHLSRHGTTKQPTKTPTTTPMPRPPLPPTPQPTWHREPQPYSHNRVQRTQTHSNHSINIQPKHGTLTQRRHQYLLRHHTIPRHRCHHSRRCRSKPD
jgi:hypothetical protein